MKPNKLNTSDEVPHRGAIVGSVDGATHREILLNQTEIRLYNLYLPFSD